MRGERAVVRFDSMTSLLFALANFLDGRDFPNLNLFPARLKRVLEPVARAINALPAGVKEGLYSRSARVEALAPARLADVDLEEVRRFVVSRYPERRYPAAMIGSASGALMHLCAALGVPWLPQTFLIPVWSRVEPTAPEDALDFGRRVAGPLLERNRDIALHHLHDPVHDRLMLARMDYFRVKVRRLGEAYRAFLEERLEPGATLFIADCTRRWPVLRVGARHVFQIGAVGGLGPDEVYGASPRVTRFLERKGARQAWSPPRPSEEAVEAEWGYDPALDGDLVELARQRGLRLRRVRFEDPEHPSPLVADLHRDWLRRYGVPARRLLVECFALTEPFLALRTGSCPFWMTFNTEVSASFLERYLDGGEPWDEIRMMLLSNGVETPGQASIARWRELLGRARREGSFLGVDEEAYPRDFASFIRYHTELERLPERHPLPPSLSIAELDEWLARRGERDPVRFVDM